MVTQRELSTLHLVSHTDALYTKSPLGRLHGPVAHIGRMRLSSVQHVARNKKKKENRALAKAAREQAA